MATACLKMALLFLIGSQCILFSTACENKEDCWDTRCDKEHHAICSMTRKCLCVPNALVDQVTCRYDGDCECKDGKHPSCSNHLCTCIPYQVDQVSCHKDNDCKRLCPPNCGITNCIGGRCICSC
ncbi:uncharacterized protein LOC126671277 [Mercurialis annua]|uniref:uncharacterized protein LOC126671277 n=1 Tax=Mercurialis annua TaxID=3986 RepID=UPI00215E2E03|nr:uncharacterized protein LOC126671277 [Mercurialis annua]